MRVYPLTCSRARRRILAVSWYSGENGRSATDTATAPEAPPVIRRPDGGRASSCRPTQPSYATSMDRDGERNSLAPRNSQAAALKSLVLLVCAGKQVCAPTLHHCAEEGLFTAAFTCPRLNIAASAARNVRSSRSSLPSLIVGRIEYVIPMLVIGEATHYQAL
jgi:hypothetical protein